MLDKLKEFCENTEIADLEERVKLNWINKKKHGKKIKMQAIELQNKTQSKRVAPWVEQSTKNTTKALDIMVENSRVKIMNTTINK